MIPPIGRDLAVFGRQNRPPPSSGEWWGGYKKGGGAVFEVVLSGGGRGEARQVLIPGELSTCGRGGAVRCNLTNQVTSFLAAETGGKWLTWMPIPAITLFLNGQRVLQPLSCLFQLWDGQVGLGAPSSKIEAMKLQKGGRLACEWLVLSKLPTSCYLVERKLRRCVVGGRHSNPNPSQKKIPPGLLPTVNRSVEKWWSGGVRGGQ